MSRKEKFSKCNSFVEQKNTRYIRENIYFGIIIFSCLSSRKQCLRFLLNYFVREIKGLYQSSFRNEVDFRDIMNVSPNILANKKKKKKLRHCFVDERAPIITTLISFCRWKILAPFCLRKKIPKKAFLTLIVNYRTEKQIMLFQTTVNCLLNDI